MLLSLIKERSMLMKNLSTMILHPEKLFLCSQEGYMT